MTARLITLSATLALGLASIAPALAVNDAQEDADDARRLAAASAHAGEPVKTVRFLRPVHSYEVVGEHAVLVWETPFKAWLVELRPSPACRDLDLGISVGLDTSHDTLNTSNGYVVAEHGVRCKMERIREVDVPAMKAAERGAKGEA